MKVEKRLEVTRGDWGRGHEGGEDGQREIY